MKGRFQIKKLAWLSSYMMEEAAILIGVRVN
jgi:hypothetical protein